MDVRINAGRVAAFILPALIGASLVAAQTVVEPISPQPNESFVPKPGAWCGTGILQVVETDGPAVRDFPLKHTKVDATVSGTESRVVVTQVFTNPYDTAIEAVYVFPLPHEAAVTEMHMRLGERVIRGLIERREEARRIYEQARQNGHVASLLEQERPNIFTQSVANILPGNDIEIAITYVEHLESDGGTWEFAFPMVVGPRYTPPGSTPPHAVMPVTYNPRQKPKPHDSDRINPPFLPPSIRSGHDIELNLTVDAGVRIDNLRSPTHAFTRQMAPDGQVHIGLHAADTIPNKDFVVRWDIDGTEPEIAVLTHHDGTNGYVSVVVHPKRVLLDNEVTPKEMVFVLDCSGSMRGAPMAAAKALARRALLDMGPADSFQIIRFSTHASGFSPAPVAATPDNVRRGLAYLDRLSGSGGTHMIEGIRAALDYPADAQRLRIVMFLTDGYIGNENDILAAVRDRIGAARLFSFGVGSSVNRFLLEEMAREGRGEVQYQLAGSNVDEQVEQFYARFRHPYLTDIEVEWHGVEIVDAHPVRIPDLFEGRSLTIRGRYERGGEAELRIRGRIAGHRWERTIGIDLPGRASGNPAIGSLWARARIADLERSMRHGQNPSTIDAITELGLTHRLVTRWTSFVAVEEKLVVSNGRPQTVRVPVEMPQGVSWEGVFGGDADQSLLGCRSAATQMRLPMNQMSLGLAGRGDSPKAALPAELQSIESEALTILRDAKDETLAKPATGLAIEMSVVSSRVPRDGTIRLRIVFTNRSKIALSVPADGSRGFEGLGLRFVDSAWREGTIGASSSHPSPTLAQLAPGATLVREVDIPVSSLATPTAEGMIHIVLDGALWGSNDTPRVVVRIGTV